MSFPPGDRQWRHLQRGGRRAADERDRRQRGDGRTRSDEQPVGVPRGETLPRDRTTGAAVPERRTALGTSALPLQASDRVFALRRRAPHDDARGNRNHGGTLPRQGACHGRIGKRSKAKRDQD